MIAPIRAWHAWRHFRSKTSTANRASKSCSADPIPINIFNPSTVLHRNNIAQFFFWMKLKIFHFFSRPKKVQKIFFHFIKKKMKNHDFWWFLMIFIDFSSFFGKYFVNFFLVEKKNENFSTSSKTIFFEQYYFYEVLRFKFLLESGQPNMICSRHSPQWFLIENVSRHVML